MAMTTQALTRQAVRRRGGSRWRRPAVIASFVFLGIVVLMAVFAPLLTMISGSGPYEFHEDKIDPIRGGLPIGPFGGMSAEHWFGVEPLNGRDIFARIVYGAQVSLTIAVSAAAVTTVLGVVFGVLAGFFGGIVDQVVSRVMDFLMAFPALIFMIAILSALPQGNRPALLVAVLALFGWPATARVVRGQTMSIAQREFVEAARASGASRIAIVFKEVLPNLVGTITVMATLSVPTFIATEAGLSFLGVGVRPPTASWGQMISSAVPWYASNPMFFMIPGLFLTLTVLSFMVIGDTLQATLQRRTQR
ncbi:peptide/nickel transport system permease protein [Actinoalloteichus hoggarensis]|uniref:Oligopeptide transport system permease protein OppC n=1 Tax=Actinoalloteichus hoggarensis TaxID=1470176 RepID=A0A221W472_9PSEU|nr:ABC transporter permease [Actinoalloteichus hoggarensis]ASO20635.1 Oligopeptide transport system permease protein OppC [Actinoalloteichus hoggarensis]MBB5923676.1 peptide/nickel transport system permease protein [Actinoalloteichus hoggarensis]